MATVSPLVAQIVLTFAQKVAENAWWSDHVGLHLLVTDS